jgi:hypothetical protein
MGRRVTWWDEPVPVHVRHRRPHRTCTLHLWQQRHSDVSTRLRSTQDNLAQLRRILGYAATDPARAKIRAFIARQEAVVADLQRTRRWYREVLSRGDGTKRCWTVGE